MEKLKNKKSTGITLIDLIITIIVMLILVGVTITVALNGGLFTTAQDVATNTMIESEKEQLLSAVVASIGEDAKVNFAKLDSNLPTGEWSGTNGTYTSPKGNEYTVSANGTITKEAPSNIKYVYGEKGYYIVILKSNETFMAYSGTKMPSGTYREDVDITSLQIYSRYNIDEEIKGFKKFIFSTDNRVAFAISDDNLNLYTIEQNWWDDDEGEKGNIGIRGEKMQRVYDADLSAYNF